MIKINLPLHPILTHFPIALFISALILEILGLVFKKESFNKTSWHMYVLAVLFTPSVVLTGLWETDRLNLHHPVLFLHKNFALWTLGLSTCFLPSLCLIRKKFPHKYKILFLLVLTATVSLTIRTAYNGGRLVYEYGVGISY